MGKLNYSITFKNGTNTLAPPREQILDFTVYSNNLGIPTARIYEEGTTPPAYISLTAITGGYQLFGGPALVGGKTYVLDYKDSAIEAKLFEFDVRTNNVGPYKGNIDYNSAQEIIAISAVNGDLSIYYNVTGNAGFANSVSIDGGLTYRGNYYDDRFGGNRYSAFWSESELIAAGYGGQVPSITFKTFYPGQLPNEVVNIREWNYIQPSYTALAASASTTNSTAAGANDGTITLTVSGGSGSFTYSWGDGPTTKNRTGLAPGLYSVTITDTLTAAAIFIGNIEITEPQPEPQISLGTVLEAVKANPLVFVPEDSTDAQTLDNRLFCEQVHEGYLKGRYYNKYEKTDSLVMQFRSNFLNNMLQMFKEGEATALINNVVVLKQANIGLATDYAIRITNSAVPGRSNVYSQTSNIVTTTKLSIGDTFEIVNNVDGFNGVYAVVDKGVDFYTITKNYAIPDPSSNATGRFIISAFNYNIFESEVDLSTLDAGKYYFKFTGISDNSMVIVSEPIDVQVSHPSTVGISYRNIDNSFGTTWATGFTGFIRVPASFFKRLPGGERSIVRSAAYKLIKINAKKKRVAVLEIFGIPPYLVELLSLVFDCDYFSINGVQFQTEEGMGEPEYVYRSYLANVSTNVEQVNWIDGYNSTDTGSVSSDSGFIKINETGFLKR